MKIDAKAQIRISKPVHEVFEAIVDPRILSKYFVSSASGRLQEDKTITWAWADTGEDIQVTAKRIETDHFVSLIWEATGIETIVEFKLSAESADTTLIKLREHGWDKDDKGIQHLAEQTQGWVEMLYCMKAYLEYGISLRSKNVI